MLADTLREIAGSRLVDTDGDVTILELLPPATDEQIRALEASIPAPLPNEIRAALAVSTGLANGPLESFSFLDLEGFGLEEAFPHAYSIAHDGYGNYWILDLLPDTSDWGPVFFACHDPAVIAYQSPSIDAFLRDVVAQAPSATAASMASDARPSVARTARVLCRLDRACRQNRLPLQDFHFGKSPRSRAEEQGDASPVREVVTAAGQGSRPIRCDLADASHECQHFEASRIHEILNQQIADLVHIGMHDRGRGI